MKTAVLRSSCMPEPTVSTHLGGCWCCWQVNELLEILSSANKAHELFVAKTTLIPFSVLGHHARLCCTFQNPLEQKSKMNFINKHYRILLNIVRSRTPIYLCIQFAAVKRHSLAGKTESNSHNRLAL